MYKLTMKSKMLDVLSPDSTAPESHKDLAAKILKFMATWTEKGPPEMGDYLADIIWKGMSSLREVDGRLEYVPAEENPKAPEWDSWAWVRTRLQTVATPPVVTPIPSTSKDSDFHFIEEGN